MKAQIFLGSLLFLCFAAYGGEVIQEISWTVLLEQNQLISGEVESAEENNFSECLRVANEVSEPTSIHVLTLEEPGVTTDKYALEGMIRYEGVEGEGYLEMWSQFPGHGEFFSRTLRGRGPMKKIEGNSDWRPAKLPFYIKKGDKKPACLTLNVVLPGEGVVYLGPLHLIQYQKGEDPMSNPGDWWSERGGGIVGGVLGCLGGLFGCLVGTGGTLASRGRGRVFAFASLILMAVAGGILTILGLVALALSQPYHVFFPLLIVGPIELLLGILFIPVLRNRYAQFELRKMDAMDAKAR